MELLLTKPGINVNQVDHLDVCLGKNGPHFISQRRMVQFQQSGSFLHTVMQIWQHVTFVVVSQ
jgi:hypothetical protein